jgi:hypothetical protein
MLECRGSVRLASADSRGRSTLSFVQRRLVLLGFGFGFGFGFGSGRTVGLSR